MCWFTLVNLVDYLDHIYDKMPKPVFSREKLTAVIANRDLVT